MGIEVDLTSDTRRLYRTERCDGQRLITSLDPVYERDTLTPVLSGTPLPLDAAALTRLRPSYRFLAHVLGTRGYPG